MLETLDLKYLHPFEVLLCSSVYRLYCEVNQYLKIKILGGSVGGSKQFRKKKKQTKFNYFVHWLL